MELEGNSNSGTLAAFLMQLRERFSGPLDGIWSNAPTHRSDAVGSACRRRASACNFENPRFHEGSYRLGYSPEFNAEEAVWGWAREEAAGNLCLRHQSIGAGYGQQLPRRAGQPESRSQTALPDRPLVKTRRTPAKFPTTRKCTSHLGFGLDR